jgi:hypothetical protein
MGPARLKRRKRQPFPRTATHPAAIELEKRLTNFIFLESFEMNSDFHAMLFHLLKQG